MSQPITLTLARRAPRLTGSLAILVLVALLVLPFFALLPADNPLSISTYTLTLLGKILCYAVVAVALRARRLCDGHVPDAPGRRRRNASVYVFSLMD